MKKLLLLLFITATSIYTSLASDTTHVLFIGNSFVYTHNVPQLLKDMAAADGETLVFTMHAPGGISVGDVSQGNQAHMNNPLVFDLIRQGNWDYVVVQDNQGRFVGTYGSFPAPTTSKVIEGHVKILDSIKLHNPCARTLWFAGWAFKDGYPGLGTGEDCIKYHVAKCHEQGVTTDELYEIFAIANIVGGTIVIPHTRRAAEYWEALQER